jgi:hypothetical protein
MTHFKIHSEIEHEMTLRKRGKMLQNEDKMTGSESSSLFMAFMLKRKGPSKVIDETE